MLLKGLEDQELERLGRGRTHKMDVRVPAATNRDLVKMVAHGQFRNDLHYPLYLGSPWRSIVSRRHIVARTAAFAVLFVCLLLTGCHSSSKTSSPIAAFSRVPAAYQESPYKTDINEGG